MCHAIVLVCVVKLLTLSQCVASNIGEKEDLESNRVRILM